MDSIYKYLAAAMHWNICKETYQTGWGPLKIIEVATFDPEDRVHMWFHPTRTDLKYNFKKQNCRIVGSSWLEATAQNLQHGWSHKGNVLYEVQE
jgi:hypothetical protein